MATKGHNRKPAKPRKDKRKVLSAVLALLLALVLILPMLTMVLGSAGAVTQSEIDRLKEERQASRDRQQALQSELADIRADQAAAEKRRNILLQELDAIQDEIDNIDLQIAYYDQEIAKKEVEQAEAEEREQAQFELFCRRVRAMEEEGETSYWAVIFEAKDFSDLLSRIADIDQIMAYDDAVMDELIAIREEIVRIREELEASRAEQQRIRGEKEQAKANQESKVKEVEALLEEINADEEKVNAALNAEKAAEAKVDAEISQKQKQMEAEREKNNVVLDPGGDYMWPLPGHYRLTSKFGYRIHPISHRPQSHTGTDIPAPAGTPILAAKGGQVITSARHSSYGNYVVIDHGGGNSTLYAHMSSRAVSEGQMVSQGQVIGYVGTTGSSTGNHLHLEVRVNYSRVDPERCFPGLYNSFVRAY
ncbi:peptidase M23 [Pseudoflavonifractor sp. 524-17]|uniref:murein hydrolase activator EnvC family protein n=1 Tax=Pseudoflavonifractor sp. 524-17 TaxID=2304577 RepID=UPI00137B08A2|nr:M23 family metallopeptidase [Pseudoflavonifractor sp. 524-17]NCE63331.1 peptidase M23 [Pseudoflavonifractor sp. 524-17]